MWLVSTSQSARTHACAVPGRAGRSGAQRRFEPVRARPESLVLPFSAAPYVRTMRPMADIAHLLASLLLALLAGSWQPASPAITAAAPAQPVQFSATWHPIGQA